MTYENLEILQSNNLHLFHNNSILSNKVEQLKTELESMQKVLQEICKCLSKELLTELEGQITAMSLQIVNLSNDEKIDRHSYKILSDLLSENKNLLNKLLSGKVNLESTINKQLNKIIQKDKRITDLEKDIRHTRDQFIKLIDKNLESISDKVKTINKYELENKELKVKITEHQELIDNLYKQIEEIIRHDDDKYLILKNKFNMLSEIGKYKVSVVPALIICLFIIITTSAITYKSKNIYLGKHKCSFCAKKCKNK